MSNYWKDYWNNESILEQENMQSQVGRTHKKQPVAADAWEATLGFVFDNMGITKQSTVLELCCGNGMLTIPLAKKVQYVTAVDFSSIHLNTLQKQAAINGVNNITCVNEDINCYSPELKACSHVLLYAALQHFTEQESIILMEKVSKYLITGGVFYIGDIPDRERLWDFANTDIYASMYFDSVKEGRPDIGTWFMKKDLFKLAAYAGFSDMKIINQPDYQINSRYKFDVWLRK